MMAVGAKSTTGRVLLFRSSPEVLAINGFVGGAGSMALACARSLVLEQSRVSWLFHLLAMLWHLPHVSCVIWALFALASHGIVQCEHF